METQHDLASFRAHVASLTKSQFLETYKNPFLVVEMKAYTAKPGQINTRGPTSTVKNPAEHSLNNALVAQITPSEGRASQDRVTLGRLASNDLCIEHPSVSKVHAFLSRTGPAGLMVFRDAGSRFGTSVNGQPLEKDRDHVLESGDTIVMARSVTATYFNPADFFEYLRLTGKCLTRS